MIAADSRYNLPFIATREPTAQVIAPVWPDRCSVALWACGFSLCYGRSDTIANRGQVNSHPNIAHYRVLAKIGEDGMGEVWRATDARSAAIRAKATRCALICRHRMRTPDATSDLTPSLI